MPEDKEGKKVLKEKYKEAKAKVGKQIEDAESVLKDKSIELRKYLKEIKAVLEEWKFSIEETKEGVRVELRAVALIKYPKRKK